VADDIYYTLIGDASVNLPDRYFRITNHGYERWDAGEWTHVTDRAARNYLITKIENGDGVVLSTPAEIAGIH
jgi:hypothetical protein